MPIRNVLLTTFLAFIVFAAISYTSCKSDPCDNVVCMNLGACDNGACVCPVGFEGVHCEILSREKLIKTFNGIDSCISSWDTLSLLAYPIHFRVMLDDPREMRMLNVLNDLDDSAVCTMVATDSFIFQGSNNSLTYVGTGKVSNDSLWLKYHVERDTSSYDCTFFGQGLR